MGRPLILIIVLAKTRIFDLVHVWLKLRAMAAAAAAQTFVHVDDGNRVEDDASASSLITCLLLAHAMAEAVAAWTLDDSNRADDNALASSPVPCLPAQWRWQCAITTMMERTMVTVHNNVSNGVNDEALASSAVTRSCNGDDSSSAGVGA
jgi:hypothetical protein